GVYLCIPEKLFNALSWCSSVRGSASLRRLRKRRRGKETRRTAGPSTTRSPDEKDALMFVPNAGLTRNEEMGLSKKEDRPYFNPSAANNPSTGYMRAKDMPFARMEQYFNLQRPPKIKFEDLKSIVATNITYTQLP